MGPKGYPLPFKPITKTVANPPTNNPTARATPLYQFHLKISVIALVIRDKPLLGNLVFY